jgi:hypothetical protein
MVLQRRTRGAGYKSFGSSLKAEQYDTLSEIAYENRQTLASLIGVLLDKAISAERGEPYEPFVRENKQVPNDHDTS